MNTTHLNSGPAGSPGSGDPLPLLPSSLGQAVANPIDVSVVIPMRNEEANVGPLCAELQEVMVIMGASGAVSMPAAGEEGR